MFASLARQIRRLPWYCQPVAWLLYWPLWLVCSIFGWFLTEAFGQTKHGVKKMFAPLALPIAGLALLFIIGSLAGPEAASVLIKMFLVAGAIFVSFRIAVGGGKNKKKNHKSKPGP